MKVGKKFVALLSAFVMMFALVPSVRINAATGQIYNQLSIGSRDDKQQYRYDCGNGEFCIELIATGEAFAEIEMGEGELKLQANDGWSAGLFGANPNGWTTYHLTSNPQVFEFEWTQLGGGAISGGGGNIHISTGSTDVGQPLRIKGFQIEELGEDYGNGVGIGTRCH